MKKTLIIVVGGRRSGRTTIAAHIANEMMNKGNKVEVFGLELIEVLQPEYYWSHTANSLLSVVNHFRRSDFDTAIVDTTAEQRAEVMQLTREDISTLKSDGVQLVLVVAVKDPSEPYAKDVVGRLSGQGTIPLIVRRIPSSGSSRSVPPAPCLYCEVSEWRASLASEDWRSPREISAWAEENEENAMEASYFMQEHKVITSCIEALTLAAK